MTKIIELQQVSKTYNDKDYVLKEIYLSVEQGEFVVLIGKSGCGKTTLLKMINGLVPCEEGRIEVFGKNKEEHNIIQLRQSIGYVIQNAGLFPHLNVEQNIRYVLKLKKDQENTKEKALSMLKRVGLDESYASKRIAQCSGGEKQRIGVARALAFDPEIILMDEPFGAVDEITRRNLQSEIKQLHKELKKTIVFVTHDIEEAFKLGTRIVLFQEGRIVFDGSKFELLESTHPYVEEFFQSKKRSSYLTSTKVEEISMQEGDLYPVTITKNQSLFEVVETCLLHKVEVLSVVEDGLHFGNLHLFELFERGSI